ncbi:tudor domain-containing protein 15 [Chelmon rostratus]|uniref:tudor domain-containing protein 15 n=1 Tax=Chelmon rostratus TaxID=109905 RepID=UPI001BE960B4|nr:tudor domain-containing protein 15 [Chelmon rostratus]
MSICRSQNSGPSSPCALWPVELKLTHLDWNPEATLIHFQGQYLSICELDYNILHGEIQNIPKTEAAVDIGEFCLVEDWNSSVWHRGRVQNRKEDLFDVFLIDHGNVLSVDVTSISSCSNDLFILPPKIVCGFLANVVLLQGCLRSVVEEYLSDLIGRNVTGYIQALLPHKVLLLEAPDINIHLVRHGFGRHVDTDTFLFLVELVSQVRLKQNIEPVSDSLIEKPRRQELFCCKPSGLQAYEDILSFCRPRPSSGTRAKVRVTAAVNPELFYCQMASMETDLFEMSKKLTAVCERRIKECNQKMPENLGLLCSVKGKDGKWYRGFVQFLPVDAQVKVLFIDYGFFESVKVENIHRLPSDFDSTPIMAFPCSLFSPSDQDEAVKTQQLSFLKAGLLGRVLDVEFTSFNEEQHLYCITVIDTEENLVKEPEPIQELSRAKVESVAEMQDLSPQEEVQPGSVFVGYVEHVQNPNHFWIRTQKRNGDFEEMITQMTDHFSQVKLHEDTLLNPELGTLCCAVYEEDMHFYRAIVTDTLEHGAEVLFIDFGNIEKVPHMLIKKIPKRFSSKSAFAFCCSLFNVFPLDEVWTSATCDFFRRAVSNKALLVHVVQMRKNKFVVNLCEMGNDGNQSITELLISSKEAECWNNIPIGPVVLNSTDATEKTRGPRYIVTSDINGTTEQLEDCEDKEKTCNENETVKAHAPVHLRAVSTKPGCELAVCCSYMNSPSDFWCQPLDKVPALEELMDKLQLYYSTHTVTLQSGDSCCVAKSPQDGRWYRAFITEKQKGHAKVMLVDYGHTIQIKEHNLQALMPEYIYMERQAFRCSLYDLIEPADPNNCGNWSPEVCNSLKDFVRDSTCGLTCKVVSQLNMKNKGVCNVVDLYNTQTQQSITNLLLEQGLAKETTISTKQLSTAFPESFVFSSYDLSPGKEEQVYVTHVSSQWHIYCHLERNSDIIEELEKKISGESEKMMQASTRTVVRKLCLAKYLDGKWYRGLAHPVQSPLYLSVFFVDYGNTDISEKTHVMFIPRDSADLLYTPMQALRCNLASVSKEELYAGVKDWLDSEILNKQLRALIVGKSEDGSFDVELFDGEVNINEKVKELIRSFSPKKNSKNTKVKPQNEAKSGVSAKPLENSQAKKQTKCCDANTKSEQPQYAEKTEIPQLSCLPNMKVTKGFRTKCFISHIDSVDSFFLQLSEDEPAILKMGEDLSSGVFRSSFKATTSLRINDLVLAEYEEDGALYRSAVKDCEGSSCFKVEFVDYGNSAVMGKEKIFSIPKEYLCLPRFSISCSLLDTSTYADDTSFADAVMEKPLMVDFVRQCGTHWKVKVEILDGAVGPPAPLGAAVESNTEPKKEKEAPVSSSETEERVKSCEQNYVRKEVSVNEMTESQRATSTVDGDNLMLEPPSATLRPPPTVSSPKQKVETQNEKALGKSNLDASHPQKLVFAPVDIDKVYSGFAAAVTTPFEFCVVLGDSLVVMNKVSTMLDELSGQVSPLPGAHLVPGNCCLLKSDTQNKWCRAEITQCDTAVILNLVDYGHYENMLYENCSALRKLPVETMNLPKVTYPCILRGVKPVGEDGRWTDEAAIFFQQCFYQKNLQIFFREFVSNTHWKVDILVDGVHVAKKLVDAGHAGYIDVILGQRFSAVKPVWLDLVSEMSSEASTQVGWSQRFLIVSVSCCRVTSTHHRYYV